MPDKVSMEQFVITAITTLRADNKVSKKHPERPVSTGIHVVYSKFNEAFREYFDGADPRECTNQLAKDGKIVIQPAFGGAMIYLPGEAPEVHGGAVALAKMGLS